MGQDRGGLRGSGEAQSTPGGEGSPSGSHSPWCTWLPESGGFAAPLLGACQLMRSGLSPTPTPTASGYMANRDLSWRWCLQPQPATIKQPQQAPRHSKQPASSHIKQPQQAETTPCAGLLAVAPVVGCFMHVVWPVWSLLAVAA